MRSRVLLAVAAIAALSACGSDVSSDGDPGADGSGAAPKASTSLTIAVTPGEGADATTYKLTCDPAGGDHPQPAQACDAISAAGASVFEPVAPDQSCTQVFGGPQTATVAGTYKGKDVDATFSRQDSCEIDRWEKLGTTVFNLPLQ